MAKVRRAFAPDPDSEARVYAMEPASFKTDDRGRSGRFCEPPQILFRSDAPTCDKCLEQISWSAPGKRIKGRGYAYRIRCSCGPDVLLSPFRLCIGGTTEWWSSRGWRLHGT